MTSWWGAVAVIVVAALGLVAVRITHRTLVTTTDPIEAAPFLSGWPPTEHALSRFHVRWYPATLLFLAFDVEMLFMYPWAVVLREVGPSGVVEMFAFLGVLMVAVLWAWREGALRWL
ncbi:MAG: NADH-quinone oxidoreductase subunit A [Nakamurella sp.]